jgi:hypothetical protein
MPKRKRESRKPEPPPLPQVGKYVFAFEAPDGTIHDPPVPLDQRMTDDELAMVAKAAFGLAHEKLRKQFETALQPSNDADEPDWTHPIHSEFSTVPCSPAADTGQRPAGKDSSRANGEVTPRVEATPEPRRHLSRHYGVEDIEAALRRQAAFEQATSLSRADLRGKRIVGRDCTARSRAHARAENDRWRYRDRGGLGPPKAAGASRREGISLPTDPGET